MPRRLQLQRKPPTNLRGIFAGCGTLLNRADMAPHVVRLTGKPDASDVTIVYLGTPSYDLPEKRIAQTSHFAEELGCTVISLDVVENAPPTKKMAEIIDAADVILVSGGNTQFAMRRWRRLGLDVMIREACLGPRRVVMAGGSAGAICWFSGGHSDSMDPDSYKEAKLGHFSSHGSSSEPDIDDADSGGGEDGKEGVGDDVEAKEWDYIRVDGLGFVPGLCCPHHDRVQSNGILRAIDFDDMMLRHPTEVGLCIDHNAAFMIDRSTYRVLRPHEEAGLPGSVMDDGSFSEARIGKPGVWIKEVLSDKDALKVWLCPESGKIDELLRVPDSIMPSVRHMKVAALSNPDDGPLRKSYPGFMTKSFFGGMLSKDYLDALLEEGDASVHGEKHRG